MLITGETLFGFGSPSPTIDVATNHGKFHKFHASPHTQSERSKEARSEFSNCAFYR